MGLGFQFRVGPLFFFCPPLLILIQGMYYYFWIGILQLQGTIIAPKSVEAWNWTKRERGAWVRFTGISGLVMNGGGQIDGQGAPWWQKYSKHDQIDRPTVSSN